VPRATRRDSGARSPCATAASSGVCDLAWVADRSDKLVSHHVRALRSAGLVRSRRDGKMVMYALTERGAASLRSMLGAEVAA
jgi:DNA-binding transcriptional ArsR family regulator